MSDIDVRVKLCKSKDEYCDFYDEITELINSDEAINKVFAGREDRLLTARMLSTLYDGDKLIGFANLVKEKQNPRFLFLDVGIIEEYRGRHVASKILEDLKRIEKYIIVETQQSNFLGNKSLENRTRKLFEVGSRNVYLLQEDKYDEFVEKGYLDLLKKHYDEPSSRMSLLEEIYKEEDKKGKEKIKTDKENR